MITAYANLDVIGDPIKTEKNQQKMEQRKLKPLSCYHAGEDIGFLHSLCARYEYIGLGGSVFMPSKLKRLWFDGIFRRFPNKKFHGYGVGSIGLLKKFPFYSTDSETISALSRNGGILIPKPSPSFERWQLKASKRLSPFTIPSEIRPHLDTMLHKLDLSWEEVIND